MSAGRHLSCAETAKLLRVALRRRFPEVKFSVRSGGASINVSWTDGPSTREVKEVTQQFQGADFDGMIDLKTFREHWLLPDGSTRRVHEPDELGEVLGAERVTFGADFIVAHRGLSPEARAHVEAWIDAHVHDDGAGRGHDRYWVGVGGRVYLAWSPADLVHCVAELLADPAEWTRSREVRAVPA